MYYGRCSDIKELQGRYNLSYFDINAILISGVPRGVWGGIQPLPKFRRPPKNRAKLNPIVKTVKNC